MTEREKADRPKEIAWFEQLIFASLALGLVQILIERKTHARLTLEPIIFGFALPILLTLLVSRRRSKVAMWLSVALFVLGIPLILWIVSRGLFSGSVPLMAAQTILQLIAYGLLFMPDAWDWLNRRPTPARLQDTFS
jgi:hypothetical protein